MKTITSQQAKDLNQNFVKTRRKAIDTAIGKKDAVSSWFSLDDLKDYIAFVEKEGADKGITVNGLRIYFGAYSKNEKKANKKNLSTVFFVPTQPKKGAQQKDGLTPDGSSDVTEIDGMNDGSVGYPPSAVYPQ
jgi:hypothetical protein